jgi:hypothetical protein
MSLEGISGVVQLSNEFFLTVTSSPLGRLNCSGVNPIGGGPPGASSPLEMVRSRSFFDLYKILFDGATHQGDCPRCLVSALVSELQDSYLVDPASSHMLVSKIKPCMSKYKHFCTVKLRMAH